MAFGEWKAMLGSLRRANGHHRRKLDDDFVRRRANRRTLHAFLNTPTRDDIVFAAGRQVSNPRGPHRF